MEYYLTQQKLDEFRKELDELKHAGRMEVADRLKRAKELGDLSENSEYFEAREEQQRVESRIFELEEIVKNASLIKMTHGKATVALGATIEVERDGTPLKFTIVGHDEVKPESGFISNESPLGKAFLGKKNGDTVEIKTPSGKATYKILKIV